MSAGNVILRGCLLTCNKFKEQTIQATNIPRKRGGRKDVRKRKIFICISVNTFISYSNSELHNQSDIRKPLLYLLIAFRN